MKYFGLTTAFQSPKKATHFRCIYQKKLLVSSCISLAILSSCSQEKSPFDISPAESLDSKRTEAPFPNIPIPADVDMESRRWKGIDYQFFDLDHGQLDVQHLQRQTNPVDARWSDSGTYRQPVWAVGGPRKIMVKCGFRMVQAVFLPIFSSPSFMAISKLKASFGRDSEFLTAW